MVRISSIPTHLKRVVRQKKAEASIAGGAIPAYWWNRTPNFGDLVTPYLLEAVTGRTAVNTRGLQLKAEKILCAAGSILQDLQPGNHIVWGSGFIKPVASSNAAPRILALRGPSSGAVAESIGWGDPKAYGDPALLLPAIKKRPASLDTRKVAIIPNYALFGSTKLNCQEASLVDPRHDVDTVVAKICETGLVISSSLHGLIVAQAYEIPWVWLKDHKNALYGGDFKFYDFFTSLGLTNPPSIDFDGEITQSLIRQARRIASLAPRNITRRRQWDLINTAPEAFVLPSSECRNVLELI